MNQVRSTQYKFVPPLFSGASAVAAVLCLSMFTAPARAQYQRTDLVSNQAGVPFGPSRFDALDPGAIFDE
jgi:hypothetical protein